MLQWWASAVLAQGEDAAVYRYKYDMCCTAA